MSKHIDTLYKIIELKLNFKKKKVMEYENANKG